jgi:hypothetical protein
MQMQGMGVHSQKASRTPCGLHLTEARYQQQHLKFQNWCVTEEFTAVPVLPGLPGSMLPLKQSRDAPKLRF